MELRSSSTVALDSGASRLLRSRPGYRRQAERRDVAEIRLTSEEKATLGVSIGCVVAAVLFPHPAIKLITALALGLTFLRVSFRHYYLAVSLFVLFLPLQEVVGNTSILVPGLNLQTALVVFFILLFLAQPVPSRGAGKLRSGAVRNPVTLPLVCLLTLLLVSVFHSGTIPGENLWEHLAGIKNGFIYTAFFWLCFVKVREKREKLIVLLFVFVAVLLNVALSLRGVSRTLAAGLIFLRHRATSLITDQPNLYGGFLALYLFFFIGFVLYYPLSKRYKVLFSLCTGLVALNLLYTLSRGAWLAAALATCFVALTKSRRMLIPVVLFVVMIAVAVPAVVVERWQDTVEADRYSLRNLTADEATIDEAASRIIQWRTFPSMLMLNPLIGIGKGRYGQTYYGFGYDDRARSPHSSIIALGVEAVIFGLAMYLWLLFVLYRSAARCFRTAEHAVDRVLSFGTMSATICLLFLDCTGTRFFSGEIMAYYWILAGITLNVEALKPAPISRRHAPSPAVAISA
jgi:O-antigen ligase